MEEHPTPRHRTADDFLEPIVGSSSHHSAKRRVGEELGFFRELLHGDQVALDAGAHAVASIASKWVAGVASAPAAIPSTAARNRSGLMYANDP